MAEIRSTQEAVEQLSQQPSARVRTTQLGVECLNQPPGTQRLRMTQIAIEFPFPGPSVPPPPGPPPSTRGDTVPSVCEPPPMLVCPTQPDIRLTNEPCELDPGV